MKIDRSIRYSSLALTSTVLLTTMLAGCSSDSDSAPVAPPAAQQSEEYLGIWDRTGYGDIVVVDTNGADLFQYTRMGCLLADRLDNNDMADIFNSPTLSADGAALVTKSKENAPFDTHFEKLATLPEVCQPESVITASTPTVAFEHLWHTFNDYYAFFAERSIDWDAQYAALSPLVDDNMSDEELASVFEELLAPLNDGHIELATGNDDIDDEIELADLTGINKLIFDTFPEQTQYTDIQDYANELGSKFVTIRAAYLDAGTSKSIGGTNGRRVTWGTIEQEVGYLRIARMQDLTTNGDEDVDANITAINTYMQSALLDLQDTSALIIDVRGNNGGEDAVGLAIANYFTDETRLAVRKSARSYAGETKVLEATISPANDTPYLKPIAIITSSRTASAAEVFLMAMSALPNVTFVGENSNGVLSDVLSKTLPNGWEFSLSNEVYLDYLGMNPEVTGIAPTVPAAAYSLEAIAANTDASIDAALQTLGY